MDFAGISDIKEKLLKEYNVDKNKYNVHLDGYNLSDYWLGKTGESPRREFFYFSDNVELLCLRYGPWKIVFAEQKTKGTLGVWAEPFTLLRMPKIFNLRTDPYEMADITSNTYWDWVIDHAFLLVPAKKVVINFFNTFKKFPPRNKPTSFTIDKIVENMEKILDKRIN
jgi:arylsulfatase